MTGREYTAYSAIVPSQHFGLALDVLTDMLAESRFDPEEVEQERAVIIEEINGTLNSPPDIVNELIDEVMWGDQPIGRPIAGTRETVERHHPRPDAGLSGAPLPARRQRGQRGRQHRARRGGGRVRATLGAAPSGAAPAPTTPGRPARPGPRMHIVNKDTEQAHLCIGLPALSYMDPDRYVQQCSTASWAAA